MLSCQINDNLKATKPDWQNPTLCIVTAGPQEATKVGHRSRTTLTQKVYMRHKKLACEKLGYGYREAEFDANITQEVLTKEIKKLGEDPTITGIIIQLPLPPQILVHFVSEVVVTCYLGLGNCTTGACAQGRRWACC